MQPILLSGAAALAASSVDAKRHVKTPASLFGQVEASSSIAIVSDYRRGGVSRSAHGTAFQAGFDLDEESGWSAGVFVSTIARKKGAHVEVDLFGSKTFDIGETQLSLGATAVIYPDGKNANFGIAQVTVSRPIGPVDATLSVNYAWEQENLDDGDGFYVGLRGRTPVGRLAGIPLTLGASVGYAEGEMAIEETKFDWSVSLTAHIAGNDVGLSYVDTDLDDDRGEGGFVLSIARTF